MAFLLFATPIRAETKVLAFSGSTRMDSFNKKLAKEAEEIARQMGAETTFIDLKNFPIPLYDADIFAEQGTPENAQYLQTLMMESDAIIIASPNYNGSFSATLKNVLDWASLTADGQYTKKVS